MISLRFTYYDRIAQSVANKCTFELGGEFCGLFQIHNFLTIECKN